MIENLNCPEKLATFEAKDHESQRNGTKSIKSQEKKSKPKIGSSDSFKNGRKPLSIRGLAKVDGKVQVLCEFPEGVTEVLSLEAVKKECPIVMIKFLEEQLKAGNESVPSISE